MIQANGKRRGFTLLELLVVISMIAIITGAISTSFAAAQRRAKINKATNDVKVITQAILAYENFDSSGELPTMKDEKADSSSLAFLIGQKGTSKSGDKIPALLMAQLQNGKSMLDPWGQPYRICITKSSGNVVASNPNLKTGYFLPNIYRIKGSERGLGKEQDEGNIRGK